MGPPAPCGKRALRAILASVGQSSATWISRHVPHPILPLTHLPSLAPARQMFTVKMAEGVVATSYSKGGWPAAIVLRMRAALQLRSPSALLGSAAQAPSEASMQCRAESAQQPRPTPPVPPQRPTSHRSAALRCAALHSDHLCLGSNTHSHPHRCPTHPHAPLRCAAPRCAGDKFFIDPQKLLPLERFLPRPKGAATPGGGRGGEAGGARGGARAWKEGGHAGLGEGE